MSACVRACVRECVRECVCVCVCVVVVVVVMVVDVVVDDDVVFMSLSRAYPPNSPSKHHSQANRKSATQHLATIKDTCPKTDSKGTAENACSAVGVFSSLSMDRLSLERELKEASSGDTDAVEKARTAVCQCLGQDRSCCMALAS